ncbi:hypothetical protein [Fontibacter flavus]|uniref:Uncharacterized protein n=1 Tax=Fontibacter flavus TaxID=654838 RepID=A0ABV6FQ41_9BACT
MQGSKIDVSIHDLTFRLAAAEIKLSLSPKLTKGSYLAMDDLGITKLFVITPGENRYLYESTVEVIGLKDFLLHITV